MIAGICRAHKGSWVAMGSQIPTPTKNMRSAKSCLPVTSVKRCQPNHDYRWVKSRISPDGDSENLHLIDTEQRDKVLLTV